MRFNLNEIAPQVRSIRFRRGFESAPTEMQIKRRSLGKCTALGGEAASLEQV